ncbi:PhnA domain-containing protein [Sinomicrobium weinanense]|uniref:PhnA domain-containing protein n=1 Tax=Sinomicrobium weinanense TaxID=2842200 RepID=A0A926JWW7_9FLAO|nr:alkylphosphonate utilization protein [Sinomicrobium weinanense]MBC9798672.1 PhnA domain-containing protein [Sinomicrobium weinanense]MBU3122154.1 PhnA domain-containing protein [Sinomicrobium weinanense]
MDIEKQLHQRSGSTCELSGATDNLHVYEIPHSPVEGADACILISATCLEQIQNPETMDPNHWRCLNDSMWSSVPAVQVMAWRLLQRLKSEGWPQDLLDMMYLDEETLAWASASGEEQEEGNNVKHLDSNGAVLETGDTVVLIKDLNVKGTSFTAKRGTAVRRISLVHDNPEQIEGKIDGQQIVILTKFVKKT